MNASKFSGFPFLTDEEIASLGRFLRGDDSEELAEKIAELKRELGGSEQSIFEFGESYKSWIEEGGVKSFSKEISQDLRNMRSQKRIQASWRRIDRLVNRVRDEYELVFGAFFPGKFETQSRFLGEGEGKPFRIPQIVSPFHGVALDSTAFSITVDEGMEDVEFEVLAEDGTVVLTHQLQDEGEAQFPFESIGLEEAGIYYWCFSYSSEDGMRSLNGRMTIPEPATVERIKEIIESLEGRVDTEDGALLRVLVWNTQGCYDAAVRALQSELDESQAVERRRELLLLLHTTYEKVREDYLSVGFHSEANDLLKGIFFVEEELKELLKLEVS